MSKMRYGNYLVSVSILSLTYFLGAKFSASMLGLFNTEALPVWPSAGIALAALVLYGRRLWPGVALGTLFYHQSLSVIAPPPVIGAAMIAATLQAIAGAALLRNMGFSPKLERLRDVFGLVLAAVVSPLLGATLSNLAACLGSGVDWQSFAWNWWTFWLGDAMGIIVIAPVLCNYGVLLMQPSPPRQEVFREAQKRPPPTRHFLAQFLQLKLPEVVTWLSLLLGVSLIVLASKLDAVLEPFNVHITQYPLEYLPFPLMVWGALRFGQRGTVLASLIVSSVAILGALQGSGPFVAKSQNFHQAILLLQAFMGVITITSLVLAAAVAERQRTEEALRASVNRERLLGEMAQRIRQSLDLDQILHTTVAEVRQFLQADRVFICYLGIVPTEENPLPHSLVIAESVAANFKPILGWILMDESVLNELKTFYAYHEAKVIPDTAKVQLLPPIQQYFKDYQIRASLGVPIMQGDQLFGLLIVNQCSVPRHWQEFEINFLKQLATQVAIAIQQAQLLQQVQALNANLETQVEERTHQLQQKMQELQELNDLKDLFLQAVSHNLRTPVMGTLMVLKNLLHKSPGVSRPSSVSGYRASELTSGSQGAGDTSHSANHSIVISRPILERMVDATEHTLNRLNGLLEAHASQVEGIHLNREPVNLRQLIEIVIADLDTRLTKNQTILMLDIADDGLIVKADPKRLQRVFEHLIVNAIKHNPPGVQVTLKAQQLSGAGGLAADIAATSPPQYATDMIYITIEDNGVGMSPAQCASLFELYVQDSKERQLTGIRLGLYLCRQIIAAHGGKIGVNSTVGIGSTFWFTLPMASV